MHDATSPRRTPSRPRSRAHLARHALVLSLLLGGLWIAWSSWPYFQAGGFHPFLAEKFPLPAKPLWRAALYVHVTAALTSLPACLLLLSDGVRRRAPGVHRWLGRATAAAILLALVPSGAYLSAFATGGLPSTLGFLLSGAIMAFAMVRAIATARARRFADHRRWVWHVVGQMGVAVVSRLMLVAAATLELDPELAYIVALWLPVVVIAASVELVMRRPPVTLLPGGSAMWTLIRRIAVLSPILCLVCGTAGAAQEGSQAITQLERTLLKPLKQHEERSSRFSRAARPPAERRARITGEGASTDQAGARFYTFAVDVRYGRGADARWIEDDLVGCIYPDSEAVYVEQGGDWYAAGLLLGEPAGTAPDGVCRPTP